MKYLDDLSKEQFDAVDYILDGEDALIAADVGTGKTIIALTAALQCRDVDRWLVLAPLLVATDTWAKEPAEWKHIMNSAVAIACGDEAQRIKAIESDAPIVVMNYENLDWLMNQYPKKGKVDSLPFDGLICDEIDKLKSVSSNRFKAFRNRIKIFKKRIGLTGTLVPNKLQELWGQVYMIDGGQSFGRSFYNWRKEYFYPTDFNQWQWAPFERSRAKFIEVLADLTFRIRSKDLPKVVFKDPALIDMPDALRESYTELEKEFYLKLEDVEIDAANAGILTGKLQQMCAGFSYYLDKEQKVIWHDERKYQWIAELYHDICIKQGKQLLVFYHFNAEYDMLSEAIPEIKSLGSSVGNAKKRQHIDWWNNDQIPVMALHPASAGHGLNLQLSGAHHIAFLTLPWSGGLLRQSVGRLARRGNSAKQVFVHTCLYENSVDETVFQVLSGRLNAMDDFLNDLEKAIGNAP